MPGQGRLPARHRSPVYLRAIKPSGPSRRAFLCARPRQPTTDFRADKSPRPHAPMPRGRPPSRAAPPRRKNSRPVARPPEGRAAPSGGSKRAARRVGAHISPATVEKLEDSHGGVAKNPVATGTCTLRSKNEQSIQWMISGGLIHRRWAQTGGFRGVAATARRACAFVPAFCGQA